MLSIRTALSTLLLLLESSALIAYGGDRICELQTQADSTNQAEFGHWGWQTDTYELWGTHSNRLIPVYTFGTLGAGEGIDLTSYQTERSPYRSEERIQQLYGQLPTGTLNPEAEYFDQTNIADIQQAALAAGKKHIILVVFDGMDWQTTRAASIHQLQNIAYEQGRGTGLHLQDYTAGGTTQFGMMVTSPYAADYKVNVNDQSVTPSETTLRGGYSVEHAGPTAWSSASDLEYLVGKSADSRFQHAYTDSASSATSMTAGIKTYNAAINVGPEGAQVQTIAHAAQSAGYRVGVVTSVPISHATPAAAYAHNVDRDDYQDLTRDLLGLKSISHQESPLPGVDVLLGAGFGESREQDKGQGENFVPGNPYLTDADLQAIDARGGGAYQVVTRASGVYGGMAVQTAADEAAELNRRLFGFFGVKGGHLPYRTANGDFRPTEGRRAAEQYTDEDVTENPTLSDLTTAALTVLGRDERPFWLLVEAGDVDWANHDNNIDNSIGAVLSGDAAVKTVTDWVETHSDWSETVLIVTADHGHYLVLEHPELLVDNTAVAE
ncbi:MAG: alkaline phosphatase [Planctomycetaceae bacterium]|nr:alkaline phosphatase [Planctomycetaceae bacterium]